MYFQAPKQVLPASISFDFNEGENKLKKKKS